MVFVFRAWVHFYAHFLESCFSGERYLSTVWTTTQNCIWPAKNWIIFYSRVPNNRTFHDLRPNQNESFHSCVEHSDWYQSLDFVQQYQIVLLCKQYETAICRCCTVIRYLRVLFLSFLVVWSCKILKKCSVSQKWVYFNGRTSEPVILWTDIWTCLLVQSKQIKDGLLSGRFKDWKSWKQMLKMRWQK